jgi:hypothetical protein
MAASSWSVSRPSCTWHLVYANRGLCAARQLSDHGQHEAVLGDGVRDQPVSDELVDLGEPAEQGLDRDPPDRVGRLSDVLEVPEELRMFLLHAFNRGGNDRSLLPASILPARQLRRFRADPLAELGELGLELPLPLLQIPERVGLAFPQLRPARRVLVLELARSPQQQGPWW